MSSKTYRKLSVVKITTNFREATQVVSVPLVSPNDDEILLKNIFAGVNETDVDIAADRYFIDGKVPFDLGIEVSALGIIEAVGKNVTDLKVGQSAIVDLCAHESTPRAYAEYVYAKPEEVIPVPSLNPEYIALMVCGLTAAISLDENARIRKGDKVLITAAAGGTGHIAVKWAKLKGCYVIGTTSTEKKAKYLRDLGCDRVINYNDEIVDEVLTNEFPSGVDVVWETTGGQMFEKLFKHLAQKGRLVIVGGMSGQNRVGFPDINTTDLPTKLLMGNKYISGFLLDFNRHLFAEYLRQLIQLVVNKELKISLDFGENTSEGKFRAIESVVRGVEHLQSGQNSGKVVIKIQKI